MKYCGWKFYGEWLFWAWIEIAVTVLCVIGGLVGGFAFIDMLTLSALKSGFHL